MKITRFVFYRLGLILAILSSCSESDSPLQSDGVETPGDNNVETPAESTSLCDPKDNFIHVIITPESFKNANSDYSLKDLQEYRTNTGISSTIITTEDIYRVYEGVDKQEKIRNFIKDAFKVWKTKYVLLAGDSEQIPVRYLRALNKNVAADMYYGCLEGNFNANGNSVWGEANDDVDLTFEVCIGRASANSIEKMSNFVYKTLTYEKSPINASYHTKMLLWNAYDTGVGDVGPGTKQDWLAPYLGYYNKISGEFFRRGVNDSNAKILQKTRFSSPNLGYFLGAEHGAPSGTKFINIKDVAMLEDRDQFFFYASLSCLLGKFDGDCYAEALTVGHRHKGAFAGFFNSQEAIPPYINQYLNELRDKYFKENITRLGELRAAIPLKYSSQNHIKNENYRYLAYYFNLFGDPATEWRLKKSTPVDLMVDFSVIKDGKCIDNSGNDNSLILKNGVSKVVGLKGDALSFNGINGYLEMPHNSWNPMGDQIEITINALIKASSDTNKSMTIASKGKNKRSFDLVLTPEGKISFSFNINEPENARNTGAWISNSSVTDNQWHYISVMINYDIKKIQFYIDGKLDKEQDLELEGLWYIGITDDPLYIGTKNNTDYFKGEIDEFSIYSSKMSEDEIINIHKL